MIGRTDEALRRRCQMSGTVVLLVLICVLPGCVAPLGLMGPAIYGGTKAVGATSSATNVTDKYTEEELNACYASLTSKDQLRISEATKSTSYIPLVGSALMEEAAYEEMEEICIEKGVFTAR